MLMTFPFNLAKSVAHTKKELRELHCKSTESFCFTLLRLGISQYLSHFNAHVLSDVVEAAQALYAHAAFAGNGIQCLARRHLVVAHVSAERWLAVCLLRVASLLCLCVRAAVARRYPATGILSAQAACHANISGDYTRTRAG